MRTGLAFILFLSVGPLNWRPALAQERPQPSKKEKSPAKAATTSMTGCIDQQDGQYVLLNEQSRSTIANLEAQGFPTEGFAKHVGHKVTVKGTANPDGAGRPTFKVRSIETVKEGCGS
jgi:hypothetical protein